MIPRMIGIDPQTLIAWIPPLASRRKGRFVKDQPESVSRPQLIRAWDVDLTGFDEISFFESYGVGIFIKGFFSQDVLVYY